MVEMIKYLLLGLLQGITEPLPISSSGHLVILQAFMNMPNVDYFMEVIFHFASLLAILVLFRVKIFQLIKGNFYYVFKRDKTYQDDFHYALLVLLGVVPAGIAGLLFKSFFEGFLTLIAVGISLLVTGLFLITVQRQSVENEETNIRPIDALSVGMIQIFALLPGISRSGATYVGGLFRRLKFETVVEFSFMMYIPISIGTMILELFSAESFKTHALDALIVSFIASAIMTYFAFKWFMNAVKQGNLKYFAYYCFVVGTGVIVYSVVI